MDALNIGISEFADRLGVSRKTISAIVNGHQRITPDMAVRLSLALPNTDAEMWLKLQSECDLFESRQRLAQLKIQPVTQSVRV